MDKRMVRIITDSAADFSAEEEKELGVTVIHMSVTFGEETYLDGVDLLPKDFYGKLIERDTLPQTSQITPYEYEEIFKNVEESGDSAVVITLSSGVSGTCQNAFMSAGSFENIYVVDSLNVTVGEQCLVRLACGLRDNGFSAKEISEKLDEAKKNIKVLALVDTLEYLKKGGRISGAAAMIGEVLSIKPVVTVVDGKVEIAGKARGSRNGNNLLMELVKKSGGIDFELPVVLGYSGLNDDMLNKYVEDSRSLWEGEGDKLLRLIIGPTIGTHVGPGAVAIGFFAKQS